MTPGRILAGEERFITLLREAKVEPELIINDNVRAKLSKADIREPLITLEPEITTISEPPIDTPEPIRTKKRKLIERRTAQWLPSAHEIADSVDDLGEDEPRRKVSKRWIEPEYND